MFGMPYRINRTATTKSIREVTRILGQSKVTLLNEVIAENSSTFVSRDHII